MRVGDAHRAVRARSGRPIGSTLPVRASHIRGRERRRVQDDAGGRRHLEDPRETATVVAVTVTEDESVGLLDTDTELRGVAPEGVVRAAVEKYPRPRCLDPDRETPLGAQARRAALVVDQEGDPGGGAPRPGPAGRLHTTAHRGTSTVTRLTRARRGGAGLRTACLLLGHVLPLASVTSLRGNAAASSPWLGLNPREEHARTTRGPAHQ